MKLVRQPSEILSHGPWCETYLLSTFQLRCSRNGLDSEAKVPTRLGVSGTLVTIIL